ncbi:MAG: hypothetical protein HY537_00975 [Deltaproteobacteria bacterium]|nr:hypothetical protein [Deltaproteobacteria bacterium]
MNYGKDTDSKSFRLILCSLVELGAKNINLISPTHVWQAIHSDLSHFTRLFSQPLILKISGYETQAMIREMAPLASVFVPDFKLWSPGSARQAGLPLDYGKIAQSSVSEMLRTHGTPQFVEGRLNRGILVRHLWMPGNFSESKQVIAALAEIGYRGYFNLMTQYVDVRQSRMITAPKTEILWLAQMGKDCGLQILIDGKRGTSYGEHETDILYRAG